MVATRPTVTATPDAREAGHPQVAAPAPRDRRLRNGLAVTERLRAYIGSEGYGPDDRLPPERDLAQHLGVPRSRLREALATLEAAGEIWRHVGRGTFVGHRPSTAQAGDAAAIARLTNPMEVIEARFLIEPKLAAMAALRATDVDLARMEDCLRKGEAAGDGAAAQHWGDALHRTIAGAAGNALLTSLFETVYAVREATNWGRLRPAMVTAAHLGHVWQEHRACVAAIRNRDAAAAERLMRQHIDAVQDDVRRIAAESGH